MSKAFQVFLLTISASLMMAAQTYHITPIVTSTSVIDGQNICVPATGQGCCNAGESPCTSLPHR